jgi:hypothetical protein
MDTPTSSAETLFGFQSGDEKIMTENLAAAWNKFMRRNRRGSKSVSKNIRQKDLYAFLWLVYTEAYAAGYKTAQEGRSPTQPIPAVINYGDNKSLPRSALMTYTTEQLPEKFQIWPMYAYTLCCRWAICQFFKEVPKTKKQRSS